MKCENFKDIYRKYRGFSTSVAEKVLKDDVIAEDISQEVFSHLYEIRATLDFSNEKMIKSLIFTATVNKCKDYFKKSWKKREIYQLDEERYRTDPDNRANPESILIRREEMKYWKLALEKLRCEHPMNYDILIKTKYFEIPPEFVAEEYGITRHNVNNRVLRTKKWMRKEVEKLQKKRL